MSDRIEILGIEAFGFHGVFGHERKEGQTFRVDVVLHLELNRASLSDELSDTVDYGAIGNLVEAVIIGEPFSLLEKLAGVIADRLIQQFFALEKVEVTVHKPQAPLKVKFRDVAVTLTRSR